jgi:hypothetical protein
MHKHGKNGKWFEMKTTSNKVAQKTFLILNKVAQVHMSTVGTTNIAPQQRIIKRPPVRRQNNNPWPRFF